MCMRDCGNDTVADWITRTNFSNQRNGPIVRYYQQFDNSIIGYVSITKTASKVYRKWCYDNTPRTALEPGCDTWFTVIRDPHHRTVSGLCEFWNRLSSRVRGGRFPVPPHLKQICDHIPEHLWRSVGRLTTALPFDQPHTELINTLLEFACEDLSVFDEHLEPQVNFIDPQIHTVNTELLAVKFERHWEIIPPLFAHQPVVYRNLMRYLRPISDTPVRTISRDLLGECVRKNYMSDYLLWRSLDNNSPTSIVPEFE